MYIAFTGCAASKLRRACQCYSIAVYYTSTPERTTTTADTTDNAVTVYCYVCDVLVCGRSPVLQFVAYEIYLERLRLLAAAEAYQTCVYAHDVPVT
jgi:hypothetical protein